MRTKIIIFAAILLLCNLAYGQTVSKDNYEKAVDYLNCRTVELSLKIYAESKGNDEKANSENTKNYENYKRDFPCDDNSKSDNIIARLKEIDYTGTKKLADEIANLKRKYKKDLKPDEAVEFLSETVLKGSDDPKKEPDYPELAKFATNRKNDSDFPDFQNRLKENLKRLLPPEPATNANANSNSNTNVANTNVANIGARNANNANTATTTTSGASDFNPIYWIAIIVLFLLAGAFAIYVLANLKALRDKAHTLRVLHDSLERKTKVPPVTTQKLTVKQPEEPSNLGESPNLSEEVNKLRISVAKLKEEIKELKDRIDKDDVNRTRFEKNNQGGQQLSSAPRGEVFYLSTPNMDGSFNETSVKSTYQEGASIYKFTKTSANDAEFQIDNSESSVKLALAYPDKNIEPACEAQNAYDAKADRIATVQSGKAVLDGDKWRVTKKAQIKYIY